MYSQIVMDHFSNPRNVGDMADADGVGELGSPVCGDMMKVYIKVEEGRIVDVKFRTFGCGAAIASSSIATEMVKGRAIEEALALTKDDIVQALGGLPEAKIHCSVLATDAIQKAIEDYRSKAKA